MDEKAITGGISFKNKRKWDKDEKPEEPPEEPIVEDKREDVEFMLRQERLQGRIDVARGFNYTGLAANTGGAYFILFGVYGFINDPNSAIVINTINDLLFIDITHEEILEFIETWKAHLLSAMASGQAMLTWYQEMRKKMKSLDNESFFKVLNDELGRVL